MKILGIDFTSRPSRRKKMTCIQCSLDGATLRVQQLEEWASFAAVENALERRGLWVAGIDFPFGQARRFIETIGWPASWPGYVAHAAGLGREEFRTEPTRYREHRAAGDKEHRRETHKAAGSISPQKLYGIPVGLMFFEGAPHLLASGVSIPHLKEGDPARIAVEAYPGILARALIDRRSYKNDTRSKQTRDQHEARLALLECLRLEAPERYGISIEAPSALCDDPGADHLDALLCAVQAAWTWQQRENGYGAPTRLDPLEGWIADPHLVAGNGRAITAGEVALAAPVNVVRGDAL